MERQREERSLGELFAELSRETSTLVRDEVRLAKAEISEKIPQMGKHIGMIAAGGALAYAGLLAIAAALIIGLGAIIPVWLSALLVGLLLAGGGYLLIQQGREGLKGADLVPHRTLNTLKEDAQWASDQVR